MTCPVGRLRKARRFRPHRADPGPARLDRADEVIFEPPRVPQTRIKRAPRSRLSHAQRGSTSCTYPSATANGCWKRARARQSGSVADSYDNAMAEALNGSFKAELIEHQGPWRDADQVEHAVVQWVGWYNTVRLHSALGYVPPEEFEAAYYRSLATSNAA
ncbi:integrase core domain-containing protein [Streptomyces sp. MI02-2A]|nr:MULTISPECIES: integrase core domain-containing protein [unclassified Streptomyces]MDX3262918.1 integrase core domain-containing protein [Streptomyces sp. MI02-2A]